MAGGLCYLVAGGKWNAVVLSVGPRRVLQQKMRDLSYFCPKFLETVGWVFGFFFVSRQDFVRDVCDDDSLDIQSY